MTASAIGTTILNVNGSSSSFTTGLLNIVNTNTAPQESAFILAPNMTQTTSANGIVIGQSASANNSFMIQYNHVTAGSTTNYLSIYPYSAGGGFLCLNAAGNVGIGLTNPGYNLQVQGSIQAKNLTHFNWNNYALGSSYTASTLYYKIASVGPNTNSANGHLIIKGSIGGWTNITSMNVDLFFMSRGGITTKGIVKAESYTGAVSIADIKYYDNGSGYDIYIVTTNFFSFDLDVGSSGIQSLASVLLYDPSTVVATTTSPGALTSITAACQMYINGSNVGIGKINPTAALDVTGSLFINNGAVATSPSAFQGMQMAYVGTGSTGYGYILCTNPGATWNSLCLNPTSGNVGIGLTNPSTTLHVNGSITTTTDFAYSQFNLGPPVGQLTISSATNNQKLVIGSYYTAGVNQANAIQAWDNTTGQSLYLNPNGGTVYTGSSLVALNSSGNSLTLASTVGTLVVGHVLGNFGSAFATFYYNDVVIGSIDQATTSSILFNSTSDRRLKNDITVIQNPIIILKKLKPVSFNWIADSIQDIGFIADEFQEVFPLYVQGHKDEVDSEGNPKYQSMTDKPCASLLVACVQEQQVQIETQAAQLATQATQIATLQQQMAALLVK
jgi:hypothetical protein